LEAIKQLLEQTQPYKVILGARNIQNTHKAYDELQYDRAANGVTILPLDLSDLKGVKSFAEKTLEKLGQGKIDYLLLNAGISNGSEGPGPHGSKWCEAHIVNHLCKPPTHRSCGVV
jgi:NADP-dependent 3-hydroxy acid dehydrogenase YdfG